MDIRKFFNLENTPYYEICREERNLCALLYHLLLKAPGNLQKFLTLIGVQTSKLEDVQIYLEFAYLRDIWKRFGEIGSEEKNQRRRQFILDALKLQNHRKLRNCTVEEFNSFFTSRPSRKEIQSPSRWSITRFDGLFRKGEKTENGDLDLFEEAAKFKWCFNVKPDIVIITSEGEVISIEAKFETGEAKYPSSKLDKAIFKRRNLQFATQTKIQKKMFEILDIEARHLLLAKKSNGDDSYAWKDVFGRMDLNEAPTFLEKQIKYALKR
jgi:hypothetical protein